MTAATLARPLAAPAPLHSGTGARPAHHFRRGDICAALVEVRKPLALGTVQNADSELGYRLIDIVGMRDPATGYNIISTWFPPWRLARATAAEVQQYRQRVRAEYGWVNTERAAENQERRRDAAVRDVAGVSAEGYQTARR